MSDEEPERSRNLRVKPVIKRILLDVLLGHPDGIKPALLFRLVQQSYRFPSSFSEPRPRSGVYRQLKAKGIERRSLNADELRALGESEPVWENTMRQARRDFMNDGLLTAERFRRDLTSTSSRAFTA